MGLKEKIADLLYDRLLSDGNQVTEGECTGYASEVLEIPEIAEALREMESLDDRLADAREDGWNACEEDHGQPNA